MSCTPFTGYFVDQFDRLRGTVSHRQENISTVQEVLSGYPTRKLSPYVASELSQVISTLILLRNQNDSFSPSRLMNLIRRLFAQFAVGHQHDAQEFISCLLDRLHEELQYPLLQLVEETFLSREEEDEMTSSSTKSDYESCASLISEDSLYSLNADGTLVEQEPSFRLNGNGTHTSLDRDSAEVLAYFSGHFFLHFPEIIISSPIFPKTNSQ
jgi:Ubiquitin carboxyl-terminal hydrolase